MLNISIIGAGFSGLSSAAYLAKAGHDVNVYETHGIAGGRARKFEDRGFVFDMGPSWYWMPDVMENFFKDFSVDINSLLTLKRLDPSYRLYFGKDDHLNMPADFLTKWISSRKLLKSIVYTTNPSAFVPRLASVAE